MPKSDQTNSLTGSAEAARPADSGISKYILPVDALILLAFFVWGVWFQTSSQPAIKRYSKEVSGTDLVVQFTYPDRILYDSTEPTPFYLSLSCKKPCVENPTDVTILTRDSLEISLDSAAGPVWVNNIHLQMTPNQGVGKFLLLRVRKTEVLSNVDVFVTHTPVALPGISLEGEDQADSRIKLAEVWNGASVVITIFLAFIGWQVKQTEDNKNLVQEKKDQAEKDRLELKRIQKEKQKEDKKVEERKEARRKEAEKNADLHRQAESLAEELRQALMLPIGLEEWLDGYDHAATSMVKRSFRDEIDRPLKELLGPNRSKLLRKLSRDFNNKYETGKQSFERFESSIQSKEVKISVLGLAEVNFLEQLHKTIIDGDLTEAYRLLEKYSDDAAGLVFTIFKQFPEKTQLFFDNDYPTLIANASKENKNKFLLLYIRSRFGNFIGEWYKVSYSVESFPLETQLLQHSWKLGDNREDPALVKWIQKYWGSETGETETWTLPYSPFFDLQNPLHLEEDSPGGLFDKIKFYLPNDHLWFAYDDDRHAPRHMLFQLQTAWEIRACLAAYCRTQPREQYAFMVHLAPKVFDLDQSGSGGIVLHAIANQWIEILALNYFSYLELEPDQRQRLCYLLLWHATTLPHLRALLEEAFETSRSRSTSEDSAYIFGQIVSGLNGVTSIAQTSLDLEAFASIRPKATAHTILLIPAVSLAPGSSREITEAQLNSLYEIADQLQEKKVFIKAFALQTKSDHLNIAFSPIEILLSTEDLITSLNTRFAYVFTGQHNTSVPDFNLIFNPGVENADKLLAEKAHGSLGRMLQLGQQLMLDHARQYPDKKYLALKEIAALRL